MSEKNPIKSLNPEVARKIAAGEVIDRPCSIIRELLDNSIDSGASSITVEITEGGIEKIRVIDNGCGMTKEDLQNCARPHATSKISSDSDLMKISTLGFRGEALASIAAVSRLSIQSGNYKMKASIIEDHIIEPISQIKGTIVQSEGLFENIPARRQFLKRAGTEGLMCKNIFIEKSLTRPDISYKFIQDGITKINLPKCKTLKERFIQAYNLTENSTLFYELKGESSSLNLENQNENPQWSFNVIIGEPAISRPSKKDIFIYANGRKIQEYSLVQAIEYGSQGFFPNGTFPVSVVFIEVRPDLIDFNIHPAKREARFLDSSDLHHALSSTIKSFFKQYTYQNFTQNKPVDQILDDFNPQNFNNHQSENNLQNYEKHITYKNQNPSINFNNSSSFNFGNKNFHSKNTKNFQNHKNSFFNQNNNDNLQTFEKMNELAATALNIAENSQEKLIDLDLTQETSIKYIGSCLGTFILVEKNNCLFIIDQHATHERIIFDKLMNEQNETKVQQLLIPYKIHTESKNQDNQLQKLSPRLNKIGFTTKFISDGKWEISTIPQRWTGTQYDLQSLIFEKHIEAEEIIRSIIAITACKAAIKDGYILDDNAAFDLAKQAFLLEDPHCPHGRPVYTVFSKEQLFELVKRT